MQAIFNEHTLVLIFAFLAIVGLCALGALILGYGKLKKMIITDIVEPRIAVLEERSVNYHNELSEIRKQLNGTTTNISEDVKGIKNDMAKMNETLQGFMGEMRMFIKMGGVNNE